MDNLNNIKQELSNIAKKPQVNLYALIDGALIDKLEYSLSQLLDNSDYASLYADTDYSHLQEASPFVVKVSSNLTLINWIIDELEEEYWGVFLLSKKQLAQIKYHLSKFNRVLGPDSEEYIFRYHDPRILPEFLKSCTEDQSLIFFGTLIDTFITVNKDNKLTIHHSPRSMV